jgi:hypothetical protein
MHFWTGSIFCKKRFTHWPNGVKRLLHTGGKKQSQNACLAPGPNN